MSSGGIDEATHFVSSAASRVSRGRNTRRTEASLADTFEPGSLNGFRTGDSAHRRLASIAADSSGIRFRGLADGRAESGCRRSLRNHSN